MGSPWGYPGTMRQVARGMGWVREKARRRRAAGAAVIVFGLLGLAPALATGEPWPVVVVPALLVAAGSAIPLRRV